ncbi:BPSS1780 family membrane protein [Pseudoxanthomonas sp. JBR18]|uniref:BPSS1780 family membrane protein n=1 Tax=Pseudoxanthomonas sp. JBR18 TaxID=2969308 RepID=UPI002305D8AB|nr:BPSS1780 family membrane protein [Pseudoxanthomonas sp. JBR18]WCE05513.1 BPSS1780 family membrane protein [Pseudoxanthomonas sp. JBR18]
MSMINKVPASAGAQWLLDGLATLRRAPLQLGLLGALWALLSLLAAQVMALATVPGLFLQLLLGLASPVLFAGVLGAVRKAQTGQAVVPGDLFRGFRTGHVPSLVATLLPQVLLALAAGLLLMALLGSQGVQQLQEVIAHLEEQAATGGQPDPALVSQLPAGRLLLWLALLVAGALVASLLVFVAVPDVVFGDRRGGEAMFNSLRACLHNLPAVILFYVLLFIVLVPLMIMVQLLGLAMTMVGGQLLGVLVTNVLLMGVMLPLIAGCVASAWRQLLGGAAGASAMPPAAPLPSSTFEA